MKKIWIILAFVLLAGLWGFVKFRKAQVQVKNDDQAMNDRILHIFAMSDYIPDDIIKTFETQNNCKIKYDNFSSNEELLAKLQAGASGYDIIIPSDYMIRALIAGKLIMELDRSKIPNLKNLANDFVNVPFDVGNKYSVPYTWGTTGLIYNTKYVKGPLESWDALFNKDYAGHISLLDDEREVLGAMLHKLGYSSNSADSKELKAAQELVIKLKPSLRVFSSDPKQHLFSGDVWIAHIYSGDAAQVIRKNSEFKFFTPKEGGEIWIDNLAVPVKASHPELAHAFINYILDPPVAKHLIEQILYSSPNKEVEALLKQDNLKPSFLKKMNITHLEFTKDLGPDNEKWDQLWTEAKSR